jgi:hypothetical protein
MAKLKITPDTEDLLDLEPFTEKAQNISLNFNASAPPRWFTNFGFDELRSTTGQVAGAALDKGWQETGLDSLSRMREIRRAEEITQFSDDELRKKYGRAYAGRGGSSMGARQRPTLEEFGLTERPTMMQPDEANTKYGIPGHLSWDKPVSSLVASIQHKRKLEEVRLNSTLDRAQGFVDNGIAFGLEMGAAIVDPVGLAIGFIPLVGQARYAKLAESGYKSLSRFARGAEAGFVGSLGVEPLIYSAKTQEKADYDMYDSLMNITFGTVAGGGLFAAGGKAADAFKAIRAKSHKTALDTSIKQLANGKDVEVAHIAAHGAGPASPVTLNMNGGPPEVLPRVNPTDPPGGVVGKVTDPELAAAASPVKEFGPAKDVETSLALMDQATGPTSKITAQQIVTALKNDKFFEAVSEAISQGMGNNIAFYVRMADGNVMVVRKTARGPLSLLTSPGFAKDGNQIDMSKIVDNLKDLLAIHGLKATEEGANLGYKGTYKLTSANNMTHVFEIGNVAFDPAQNQHHVMFGPEDMMKNMFSQDPADQVFTDLNPQGKEAIAAASHVDLGNFLEVGADKYANFGGYDETTDVTQLKQIGEQKGTNKGGFYSDKKDGSVSYVKFMEPNLAMNEWVASTLYRWFGVPFTKTSIVTAEGGKTIGISSDLLHPNAKTIGPDDFNKLPPEVKLEFTRHFVIDAYLSNWDVVGNAPNWNMMQLPNGEVIRIDAGGALFYRAQGSPKGNNFSDEITEFKTLVSNSKNPTATKVFNDSAIPIGMMEEAVRRILRVPMDEIYKLLDTAVLHGMDKNIAETIKEKLTYRRYDLEDAYKKVAQEVAKEEKNIFKATGTSNALDYMAKYRKELESKLSKDELSVLVGYTGSFYQKLNDQLWKNSNKGTPLDPDVQKATELLDSAFSKIDPLSEGIEVNRGGIWVTTFNDSLQKLGLKTFTWTGSKPTFVGGDYTYNLLKVLEGELVNFPGFTSSSFTYQTAKGFNDSKYEVIAKILVPPGMKALMPGVLSNVAIESEAILPRNTVLRIKKVLPPKGDGGQPSLVLEVVDPNSAKPIEQTDAQMLKIAKAYKERGSNAADPDPILGEPIDAVGDTLKNKADPMSFVAKELEELQQSLDAQLANVDPEFANAINAELKLAAEAATKAEGDAQALYKAAQAAAVCLTKG